MKVHGRTALITGVDMVTVNSLQLVQMKFLHHTGLLAPYWSAHRGRACAVRDS